MVVFWWKKLESLYRMKELKEALELRTELKKKKPVFLKQDAHKKAKLKKNWRQPKGRHSKMRLKLRSYRKQPSSGYSSPKLVRGLSPQGIKEVHVYNLEDLKKVQKEEGILIGRTVGLRKKLTLLKKIKELKLTLLNVKDIEKFIKEAEEKLSVKKKESKEREEEKKKSKEEAVKKAEEKKKEEEKKTDDEKKKEEEEKAKQESRQKAMQQPT